MCQGNGRDGMRPIVWWLEGDASKTNYRRRAESSGVQRGQQIVTCLCTLFTKGQLLKAVIYFVSVFKHDNFMFKIVFSVKIDNFLPASFLSVPQQLDIHNWGKILFSVCKVRKDISDGCTNRLWRKYRNVTANLPWTATAFRNLLLLSQFLNWIN